MDNAWYVLRVKRVKVIKLWERFILLSAPWLELWTHQQQIVKWRNQDVLKFIFAPNVSFGVWNFLWAINIVEQFLRSFWWRETSLGRGTTLEYSSGRLHTDFFIFCSWHLKNFILVNKDVEHNWFYEALGETPHFQSCQFLKKKKTIWGGIKIVYNSADESKWRWCQIPS